MTDEQTERMLNRLRSIDRSLHVIIGWSILSWVGMCIVLYALHST